MGVERLLDLGQHAERRAEGAGQEAGPVEADAVVVADGPAGGLGDSGDRVPRPPVVALGPLPVGTAVGALRLDGPSRPAKVK